MHCSRCHNEILPSAKFCSECGRPVQEPKPEEKPRPHEVPHAGIFTEKEIGILLDVNRRALKAGSKTSAVSQEEIDKLFD